MAKTMRDYGNGSTDYGQMLMDFKRRCMDDVNNKTTIIILGDARNNYGDPKSEILREMYGEVEARDLAESRTPLQLDRG